jgi:3-hydroxy-9,10-secoandrosta-1,3,5(10)-triene-9,17-dione monooxygenase
MQANKVETAIPLHPSVGTGEQLLARARTLAGPLSERAEETERLRELPPATVEDIRRTGVHRVHQPARFGGAEAPLIYGLDIITEIGRGCCSTAWVLAQNVTHNLMVAHWPDKAQQEVWGGRPDALLSGILIPGVGSARRVEGGYALSGRWPFVSGVNVCDWAIFTALIPNEQGVAEDRHFLIPRPEFKIVDTWHTVGLRGTSSNDVIVEEAFVPEHRSITVEDLKGGTHSPGSEFNTATVFRCPLYAVFGLYIASAPMGAAEVVVEHYVAQAKKRIALMTGGALAQYTTQQVRVAEASAAVETARMLLRNTAEEAMGILVSGRLPTNEERTKFRSYAAYAGKLMTNAVTLVWEAGGGNVIYDSNPISRGFRDVTSANRHTTQTWDLNASMHGRVKLGLPLDNPAI